MLQEFDLHIIDRKGAENPTADNLSRLENVLDDPLPIDDSFPNEQESTDPNYSFRLQDPRGIQGLEGRFRIRTQIAGSTRAIGFRRDSHHACLVRAGGDDNDTLLPPRRRAGARASPPLCMLRA